MVPAQNIDEVIAQLETIIANSVASNNRAGYFAALYHKVTCRVKQGIQTKEFENGARMEQFDVVFANRYITAYDQWINKEHTQMSQSWQVAFEMAGKSSVLVLQHLLIGMNAHINLDLGVAVIVVAKEQNLPLADMKNDFNTINTILASLTYQVVSELDRISPLLSLAGMHSKNDSLFIQFAMDNARDGAWCFAEELYPKENDDFNKLIAGRDKDIWMLGKAIVDTKGLLAITVWIIHLFEYKIPAKITKILNEYKKTYLTVDDLKVK
ncbi:DUF5995 family protein [Mucilaginibacter sp. McL0603]|uniref:DUF5995 family protein n=1 Tax=Mucilaginibacter sp. McL0603 TaxID=3415670 RepID=UPI003CF68E7C